MDEEVAARMGAKMPRPKKARPALRGAPVAAPEVVQTPGPPSLDVYMLHDIEEYPESGIAGRYKRLGISVRQGEKLRARLAKEGLITDTKEQIATGSIRIIRLTEKGSRRLEEERRRPDCGGKRNGVSCGELNLNPKPS